MKLFLLLAIVVASSSAVPVLVPYADWLALQAKVEELQGVTHASIETIRAAANGDNPTVGATISEKLDASTTSALEVLAAAQVEIDAQTLTTGNAEMYFAILNTIFVDTEAAIADDVVQLSPEVQSAITSTMADLFTQVETIAKEVYLLIEEDEPTTSEPAPGADYVGIQAKVDELRALFNESWSSILTEANDDNPEVAALMAVVIDAAIIDAGAILEAAEAKISDETLTLEEAQTYLQGLEKLLRDAQIVLQDEVDQLSQSSQSHIRQVFNTAFDAALFIANEIYALFPVPEPIAIIKSPRANWAEVQAGVDELTDVVMNAVEVIRAVAINDNMVVGEVISAQLDNATTIANETVQAAQAQIDEQTLTLEGAQTFLQGLEILLVNTQIDLQDEVAELTEESQNFITHTFDKADRDVRRIAEDIYAAIAEELAIKLK